MCHFQERWKWSAAALRLSSNWNNCQRKLIGLFSHLLSSSQSFHPHLISLSPVPHPTLPPATLLFLLPLVSSAHPPPPCFLPLLCSWTRHSRRRSLRWSYTASACSGFVSGRASSKEKTTVIGQVVHFPTLSPLWPPPTPDVCLNFTSADVLSWIQMIWLGVLFSPHVNMNQRIPVFLCDVQIFLFQRAARVKVLVFALLIYLQRVRSGPSSHVSHLLLQNEVSKYISAPCTRSDPPPYSTLLFASLCFVLSYLFITAYIWLRCNFFFFFFDFCSFNICSLPVANRGAIISFHGATEMFDILI